MRNICRNLIGKPDEMRPVGGTKENNGTIFKSEFQDVSYLNDINFQIFKVGSGMYTTMPIGCELS